MNNQQLNSKKCHISYNAKHHFTATNTKARTKTCRFAYFTLFSVLVSGVAYFLVHEFMVKPSQNYYADVLPHEVYQDIDSSKISFDDIDEKDLLTIAKQFNQDVASHNSYNYESSENLLLTGDISVDPDLFALEEEVVDKLESADEVFSFEISPNSTTQYTIQSGDSLSKILNFLGFKVSDVNNFITNKDIKAKLKNIQPGQHIEIKTDNDNIITEVRYYYNLLETYEAKLVDGDWQSETITNEHTVETLKIAAEIDSTLNSAATENGVSASIINKLNSIFKEKVNLSRDIRKGDSFAVIYEYLYINGKPYKPSNVLAAELNIQGKRYTAIRHASEDNSYANYYDINGKPLVTRETYRRHPVDGVRITSNYGLRYHPILKKRKMHNGVDYGSKKGTPIYAIADGKVEHAGPRGSYGNAIITRYSSGYKSLYAHMSRLAKGIKSGDYVKKGQLVGYVGSTGRSTGPHLHYELFKGDKRVDPLTADLPREISIPDNQRNKFMANANAFEKELKSLHNQRIANANNNSTSH